MRALILLFVALASSGFAAEFSRAIEPRRFRFPQDHASHAGFQTEWWYATGNVKDASGREFGYQFTIFRRAVDAQSPSERGRKSAWAMSDFYVGHAAISDVASGKFHCDEIYGRGAANVSGATDAKEVKDAVTPIRVWLSDWEIARAGSEWTVKARFGKHALNLTLSETTPLFLNGKPGEEGLSRKGPEAGQASYYYSIPGLATRGTLTVDGKETSIVSGRSWLDREWGSNQLSKNQAGWDWFAMQFDDGSALMLYVLRNVDGSIEAASSGTFVTKDGTRTHLALADLQFKKSRTWKSPHSGGVYTLEWAIEIAKLQLNVNVAAVQDDQEINSSRFSKIFYYEGAIRMKGTRAGQPVTGDGYLEITGAPGQESNATRGLGGML